MKQLVYGGILMITGMLGVIAAILALSASIATALPLCSLSPSPALFYLRLWSFSAIMSMFVRR